MSRCEAAEWVGESLGTGLDPSIPIISLHPPLSITALVIHIHTQVISLYSWSHITFTAVIKYHTQKVTGLAAFLIDTSSGPHPLSVGSWVMGRCKMEFLNWAYTFAIGYIL